MKNKIHILILFLVLVFITACQSQENNFLNIELKNKEIGFTYIELQIDKNAFDSIVAIVNNNIIYYQFQNNDSIVYYRYDIDNKKTYKLGTIMDPFIFTDRIAQISNRLFFYMTSVKEEKDAENTVYTTLYEIDMSKNKIKELITEKLEQTLVYIDVLENDLFSLKGKLQDNHGNTYIEKIHVEEDKMDQDNLLSAIYNNVEGSGKSIENFSVSDNFIFTLNTDSDMGSIIKKYDVEGRHIKDIELEQDVIDIMNNERISIFDVMGQYAFIRNFSGYGVLCDISEGTATAKIKGFRELSTAFHINGYENTDNTLLFDRETASLWMLDINSNIIHELDATFHDDYQYINYVFIDDKNNTLISFNNGQEDRLFYLDYSDLPIKESHSLIDDVLTY